MPTWDVVVIGAGVLGTFHALFAAQQGRRTLLIERGDLPREASVRNFGLILPSAQPPGVWRERALASAAIYRDLALKVPFPVEREGLLYLATTPTEAGVLAEFAARAPALGYDCALLDSAQAIALNPALNTRTCLAALHAPGDFALDPRGLFRRLIPWQVERLGVAYLPRTVVTAITRSGGSCCVRTATGEEHAAWHVVVCTGSDFLTLFPDVYEGSGLTVCKLQMMRTVAQPETTLPTAVASGLSLRRYPAFALCPSHERLLREPIDNRLERFGVHVLLVQDNQGAVTIGDSHEYAPLDRPPDDRLSGDIEAGILAEARRLVRLSSWEIASRWSGVYAIAEDGVFEATLEERIHVVTGVGGRGMTCGPALARETIDRLN